VTISTASQDHDAHRPSAAAQIVTTVFFGGFAIAVSIVAMAMFGLIGVALAALFAWQWLRMMGHGLRPSPVQRTPRPALRPTGNASFDAYRDEMLARLEQEQAAFEEFLVRLREAKDETEFNAFMADRAEPRPETRLRLAAA